MLENRWEYRRETQKNSEHENLLDQISKENLTCKNCYKDETTPPVRRIFVGRHFVEGHMKVAYVVMCLECDKVIKKYKT